MKTIKIGRKTYDIMENDYIAFNGHSYTFNSGNGRMLRKLDRNTWLTYVEIPKSVLKNIDLNSLTKRIDISPMGIKMVYYFFF